MRQERGIDTARQRAVLPLGTDHGNLSIIHQQTERFAHFIRQVIGHNQQPGAIPI